MDTLFTGVAAASLAATIILRKVNKKFEKLEGEHDNRTDEIKELKRELKSIHR